MLEGNLERMMCIGGIALRLQNDSRIEVGRAVGTVSRPFVGKYHMRFGAPIEMLPERMLQAFANMARECRSDLDLLARNLNLHKSHVYGIFPRSGSRASLSAALPKKSGGP